MLRDEVGAGTELGREVEPIMKGGGLIPDDMMVRDHRAAACPARRADGVLLDGFPRTVPQAEELDEMLERTGREIGVVLFFDVPESELSKRIAHRAEIDHRADDTPEAFVQRMREYEAKTAPVVGYYEDRGTRVEYVNGNAPIEKVTDSILTIFGGQLPARGVA